jgi:hypothetical protein
MKGSASLTAKKGNDMQTQKEAEQRAARSRASRRSVTVEVAIDTYADATVYLDKIPTDDLLAELKERQEDGTKWNDHGELEDGFAVFTLDLRELAALRHLYLIGREVEASERCRRLLADMLGTAL